MQVTAERRELAADPGTTSQIVVSIINTGSIIDGLSARVIGAGDLPVRSDPPMLPLFPEGEGRIALSLDLPATHPAGVHPLTVEVLSQTTGTVRHADVELDVAAQPAVSLSRSPRMVRARRSGRFVLSVANTGNVALDVELTCPRRDAGTTVRFSPSTLRVEAGTAASVMAVLKGPRMITGADVDRSVDVEMAATVSDVSRVVEPDAAESPVALTQSTKLQLRQRPLLSRGLITFLILAAIVAAWAAAFLLGLGHVFSADPMTKTAPASYFATLVADTDGAGSGDGGAGAGEDGADAETPPGVMPKSGLLPPGVGGEIAGVVTAESDGSPIGRILVEAYRVTQNSQRLVSAGAPQKGEPDLVSSGATQIDGSYELAGLFPTAYRLKFSAKGYEPVWYPDAGSIHGGDGVTAIAQGVTEGIDVVMVGKNASITGKVDSGDELRPASTRIVARLLSSDGDSVETARTTTDAQGRYQLTDLVAPGTYELSFVAEGYAPTTVVQKVVGGEQRIQPTVLLSAGGGQISGTVSDGSGPLGGVTVTTTVGGEAISVITPTTGAVGAYSLQDLPTPGTYVVTFTAEGHGSRTEIVDLGAGESRSGLDKRLAAGTGSVTGLVRGADGQGLGGVEVSVGGVATVDGTAPTTTTLTSGEIGSFALNQLPAPGDYTLTFSKAGYATQTQPFTLTDAGAATVRVMLTTRLGGISGSVTRPNGTRVVGATVTATDGTHTYTATSSAPGGALDQGGYLIPDLLPGWYSVTVALEGFRQQTGMVKVVAGDTPTLDLRLEPVD